MNNTNFDDIDKSETLSLQLPVDLNGISLLLAIFTISIPSNTLLLLQQILKLKRFGKIAYLKEGSLLIINLALVNLLSTVIAVFVFYMWMYDNENGQFSNLCYTVLVFVICETILRPSSVFGLLVAYVTKRATAVISSSKSESRWHSTFVLYTLPPWICSSIFCLQQIGYSPLNSVPEEVQCDIRGFVSPIIVFYIITIVTLVCLLGLVISSLVSYCGRPGDNKYDDSEDDDITNNPTGSESDTDETMLVNSIYTKQLKGNYLPVILNVIFYAMWMPYLIVLALWYFSAVDLKSYYGKLFWTFCGGFSSTVISAFVSISGSYYKIY